MGALSANDLREETAAPHAAHQIKVLTYLPEPGHNQRINSLKCLPTKQQIALYKLISSS